MLQVASIALAILYFLGGLFGSFGFALKLSLALQVALWLILLNQQVGLSRNFSFTAEFAARCFENDAAHYAVYSLLFFSVAESIFPLIPLLCYSFFNAAASLSRFVPVIGSVLPHRGIALQYAVRFEVLLLPMLIVSAFFGGSWIAILGHYNFLKFRYMFSAFTRAVVDALLAFLDLKISGIQLIAPYYFMIRRWLALPQNAPRR